jgi:hypothetical protein
MNNEKLQLMYCQLQKKIIFLTIIRFLNYYDMLGLLYSKCPTLANATATIHLQNPPCGLINHYGKVGARMILEEVQFLM